MSTGTSTTLASKIFRARIPVGRIFNTPVSIHFSWFLWAALFILPAPVYLPSRAWTLLFLVILLLIVLAHESAHVYVAKRFHFHADEIILWALGGFALIKMPAGKREDLLIAAAGPLVNFLLVPLTFPFFYLLANTLNQNARELLWAVAWVNLAMLVLNLLPIFPLDGGRILLSALTSHIGVTLARLISSILSIAAAATAAMVLLHIHDYLGVLLLSALIYVNTIFLRWALNMFAWERRTTFHSCARCPSCLSHAVDGPSQPCPHCHAYFNPFSHEGTCWHCHTLAPLLKCAYCGQTADISNWLPKPATANQNPTQPQVSDRTKVKSFASPATDASTPHN